MSQTLPIHPMQAGYHQQEIHEAMRNIFNVNKDLLKEGAGGFCTGYSRGPIRDIAEVRIICEGLDADEIMGVRFFLDTLGKWWAIFHGEKWSTRGNRGGE